MSDEQRHCLLIGIGAGTGAACARRFAASGYKVSMIARSEERLAKFAQEIPNSIPYASDIADADRFRTTLEWIKAEQGLPDVIIFNATQATFGTYVDIPLEKFERNFRVNTAGLLITAQVYGPAMAERGNGAIVVTGNTAATRGKPSYVGWAPTKAAQRILAEGLARDLGPQGIHVAYVIIDAIIDMPFARRRWDHLPEDAFAKPEDLADQIYNVAHQPKSAWSFLVELRPFGETW
ncbi:MAG: SDR family NAD(P)-dependent oxidoreductase [Pseudomonadota bacterium]